MTTLHKSGPEIDYTGFDYSFNSSSLGSVKNKQISTNNKEFYSTIFMTEYATFYTMTVCDLKNIYSSNKNKSSDKH